MAHTSVYLCKPNVNILVLSPMVNITTITSRATRQLFHSAHRISPMIISCLFGNDRAKSKTNSIRSSIWKEIFSCFNEEMVIEQRFRNNVDLREIESCHYVYSRDLVRINMNRLRRLVELSNFIRRQIRVKYAKLVGSQERKRKQLHKKCRSAVDE